MDLIQNLSDGFCQIRPDHRFVNKCLYSESGSCFFRNLFAVPCAQDNREIRPDGHHLYGEPVPGQIRHGHICQEQIEILWLRFEQRQCLGAAGPDVHRIPQLFKDPFSDFGDGGFIVHKQNTFRSCGQRFRQADILI